MNTCLVTLLALLSTPLAMAAEPAPSAQSDSAVPATVATPRARLDLDIRRQLVLDDQILQDLERAATRDEELSPPKLFREPDADTPIASRIALNFRPSATPSAFPERSRMRCEMSVCRAYDDRGRIMYSYETARLGIDAPATQKMWESCQASQDDMLSTFDRVDQCNGIRSSLPSPWDPAPRAWP